MSNLIAATPSVCLPASEFPVSNVKNKGGRPRRYAVPINFGNARIVRELIAKINSGLRIEVAMNETGEREMQMETKMCVCGAKATKRFFVFNCENQIIDNGTVCGDCFSRSTVARIDPKLVEVFPANRN
jgi:hypothetical protein